MWISPDTIPSLIPNQVHTWKVNTVANARLESVHTTLLQGDEKIRASKFRFQKDRLTYITARAVLRKLIAAYTGLPATNIAFKYNEQSKPYIESDLGLNFNVSHSGNMILLGFTLNHDIGVDIEYNKRPIEVPEIAKSFFSKNEVHDLFLLEETQRQAAFYNCWTRKEAFIKAKGGGLSIPLDQFEVSLLPKETPAIRVINWDQGDVVNWNMQSFGCSDDYTGAVIVHNVNACYQYFDWDSSSIR